MASLYVDQAGYVNAVTTATNQAVAEGFGVFDPGVKGKDTAQIKGLHRLGKPEVAGDVLRELFARLGDPQAAFEVLIVRLLIDAHDGRLLVR